MLLDVNILAGRDLENVRFQRTQKFAGDIFAVDAIGHALMVAGIHQVGAHGEPHRLADRHLPDVRRHFDVQQLPERFDKDNRAAARGMRPWHAHAIYIPKPPKRAADATYLTLSETLREPVSYCHSLRHLAAEVGLAVEDNDPDIIRDAVAELLTRLDGGASSDVDVADLHARADRIYQSHGHFGMARLAAGFLRRRGDFVR
jgi:hypothetical protein